MPPLNSLGFHYCKWEETSAKRLLHLDTKFEENNFPLDVLWMDIGYTQDT